MEVATEITKADYKSFLVDYYFSKNNLRTLLALLVAAIFISMLFYNDHFGTGAFGFAFMAVKIFIVLYLIFICIPYGIQALQLNIALRQSLFVNVKIIVTVYASGISIENETGNDFLSWDLIKHNINTTHYIAIYLMDRRLLLISKNDFESDEKANLFIYKINNGLLNANGSTKQTKKPSSPSYLWGLIGLIPVVGIINGVIMILMGLIQYKDYKYCFIGLMGILFSFGFF